MILELRHNLYHKEQSGIRTPLLTQSFELLSGSIGAGAGLQSCSLVQGKGSNPLKVIIMENKVIYQSINQLNSGWCPTVIKFHLHYLTVTLLTNSTKLTSNLDITCTIKKKSGIRTSLLTQSLELLSS